MAHAGLIPVTVGRFLTGDDARETGGDRADEGEFPHHDAARRRNGRAETAGGGRRGQARTGVSLPCDLSLALVEGRRCPIPGSSTHWN
jgi:hypothetical protein